MSNRIEDKWLVDFRKRMEDYTEPLPEGFWEELEGELAPPKIIPFWRRWPSIAAAVALVLLVSSLALSEWFSPLVDTPEIRVANQMVEEKISHDVNPLRSINIHSSALPTLEARVMHIASEEVIKENPEDSVINEETMMKRETIEEESTSETKTTAYPRYHSVERTRENRKSGYVPSRNLNRHEQKLEIGLHTGGMPYGSSKDFTGMTRLSTHRTMNVQDQFSMGGVNSKITAYNQVLFSNRDKYTHTDVKHRMPINVVASVKWHFAEKWALETGLSYTYMQSELHSGSNLYWEETQKLHYVGIPIKLHRDLWSNSLISLYASAGGMLEKCVKGSLESVYVTSNSTKEVENHSIHSHPLQWSVATAVGAQVNLIRSLSLFVEPGIAYYFDDNSDIETIRKEHPFNFNLQFGLRFNLSK